MAQPKALWAFENQGQTVVIYNQGPIRYPRDLWDKLKNDNGYTDDDLAQVLNNLKP